jgi:thiamine monophosphate synthase
MTKPNLTALGAAPDYIALGPVYPTILKQMKWAPQGLERLREWKHRIGKLPLVAIGGLNLDRIDGVFASGARQRCRRHRYHPECRSGGACAGVDRTHGALSMMRAG